MSSEAIMPKTRTPAEAALLARLMKLPEAVNASARLTERGRFLSLEFQVAIGSATCFIALAEGRIRKIEEGPRRMRSCAFILSAPPEAWEKFWLPMPPPWYHDLFAMNKKGFLTIEGDLHPFMGNLQYFKDLLALPRRIRVDGA